MLMVAVVRSGTLWISLARQANSKNRLDEGDWSPLKTPIIARRRGAQLTWCGVSSKRFTDLRGCFRPASYLQKSNLQVPDWLHDKTTIAVKQLRTWVESKLVTY